MYIIRAHIPYVAITPTSPFVLALVISIIFLSVADFSNTNFMAFVIVVDGIATTGVVPRVEVAVACTVSLEFYSNISIFVFAHLRINLMFLLFILKFLLLLWDLLLLLLGKACL